MSEQYPNPNNQYGAPQPGAPQPAASSDDNTWAALAHFGGIVLGFIAPLIVMLTKGNESPGVRQQSVEALNFQITIAIAYVVGSILLIVLVGALILLAAGIGSLVFSIIAGVKAMNGEDYRYPFALRLVK